MKGNCNLTRTAAMAKLIEWVTGNDIAVTKDDNILLVGDFNSCKHLPVETVKNVWLLPSTKRRSRGCAIYVSSAPFSCGGIALEN